MKFEDFYVEQDYYNVEGYPQRTRPLSPIVTKTENVIKEEDYIPGYLRTMIGKYVKVQFLIGTDDLVEKEGTIVKVGMDYIVLREAKTDDLVMGDLYSIKFVRIYY